MAPSTLKKNLKHMLDKAEGLLESLLSEYIPNDKEMTKNVPILAFSFLAALPGYISSSIAGHTKPGNDSFLPCYQKPWQDKESGSVAILQELCARRCLVSTSSTVL
jgi:hypothetical protein